MSAPRLRRKRAGPGLRTTDARRRSAEPREVVALGPRRPDRPRAQRDYSGAEPTRRIGGGGPHPMRLRRWRPRRRSVRVAATRGGQAMCAPPRPGNRRRLSTGTPEPPVEPSCRRAWIELAGSADVLAEVVQHVDECVSYLPRRAQGGGRDTGLPRRDHDGRARGSPPLPRGSREARGRRARSLSARPLPPADADGPLGR